MVVVAVDRKVMAVVLTHNAPESLARCLKAVSEQSSPPEAVLVVDNASDPPVGRQLFPASLPPVRLVRSDENGGPAGGWALALGKFLESRYEHAWMLDDDMIPERECLERLWAVASKEPPAFVFPISYELDGSVGEWPSWCGPVVAREIVEAVGLPMKELYWWAEDTEYLQWRIPAAGYKRRVVKDAVVHHDSIRQRGSVPVWKYYYEARNMLYVHMHVKHHLGRYPRNFGRLLARAILRERHGRLRRLGAIAQGTVDGAGRRLGVRFPVEEMQEHKVMRAVEDPDSCR